MKRRHFLPVLCGALLSLLTLIPASAQGRWAVVDFSTSYLRAVPDYESALETQALMGTIVEVIGEQGYWRQIVQHDPSYVAWATDLGLVEMTPEELDEYVAAPKYICTSFYSRVYNRPSTRSEILSDLVLGDLLRMVVSDKGRGVRKTGFCEVVLPDGRVGYTPARDLASFDEWSRTRNPKPANLEKTARQFLGIPYLWGGVSVKGMDCSGLVWMTYFLNGILLPRNASQQARCGIEVPLNKLKAGDLIFFGTPGHGDVPDRITHVGMSLGGKEFIHASHVVRICSLDPMALNYYSNKPALFAVRITGGEGVTPLTESPWYF